MTGATESSQKHAMNRLQSSLVSRLLTSHRQGNQCGQAPVSGAGKGILLIVVEEGAAISPITYPSRYVRKQICSGVLEARREDEKVLSVFGEPWRSRC